MAGFHGDGYVCIEEQNCLNNPTLCDMNAQCHSTNSGLVCVCNQGELELEEEKLPEMATALFVACRFGSLRSAATCSSRPVF